MTEVTTGGVGVAHREALVCGEAVVRRETVRGEAVVREAVVRESVTGDGVTGPVLARGEAAVREAAPGEVGAGGVRAAGVRGVEVRLAPRVRLGVGLRVQVRRRAHRGRSAGPVAQGVRTRVVEVVVVSDPGGAARGGAAGGGASVASHVLAFLVLAVDSSSRPARNSMITKLTPTSEFHMRFMGGDGTA